LQGKTNTLAVGLTRLEGLFKSNVLGEEVEFFNLQVVTLVDNVWRDRVLPDVRPR